MRKGHTFFVLGAAAAACAAITVGVVTNSRDDLGALVAPPVETILAASHTTASTLESTPATGDAGIEAARSHRSVEFEVAQVQANPEVEETTEFEPETAVEPEPEAEPETAAELELMVEPESIQSDALAAAHRAFMQKDYETVVRALEPMADAGDERFDVHYILGLSQRYLGQAEASEAAMQRALALQPDHVRALVNSARALLDLDRVEEAAARMSRAIDIAPDNSDAWNVLGRVQLAQGTLEEAEASFVTATEVDPSNAWAYNNLGYVRLQREAWTEAAEALAQAVALREDVAVFHNNRGVALERLQQLDEAALAYARAVQLQPDHVRAQVSLGRVMELVGGDVEALQAKTATESEATVAGQENSDETLTAEVGGKP